MMNLKDTYAGVDPILTTLAQGYMLPETNIANFIAPVVDTPTRAGRTLRFGKEAFAISDYRRAYGTNIPAVQSRFDSDPYALEQEVIAWELPEEVIENAGEGPAQVDLRAIETRNAMSRLMNAYEVPSLTPCVVTDVGTTKLPSTAWPTGSGWRLPGSWLRQADAAATLASIALVLLTGAPLLQPDHRRPELEACCPTTSASARTPW